MYNLIELRKQEPSVKAMMDKLHIMQQPSGYVDQVIMKWHLDEQGKQFPFSLAMRDLFTGAYCDNSRLVMAAISQVSAWIWGKMTPVAQLSDTTAIFPFKRFLHAEQNQLRAELKAMHEDQQSELSYKCGYYELLRMLTRALDKLDAFMDDPKKSRTLRDSVRNGAFVWRPNYTTGKLGRAEDQAWAKRIGAKVGNKRMDSDWPEGRYSWLDEAGKPLGPFAEQSPQCLLHAELKHHTAEPDEPEDKQDAPVNKSLIAKPKAEPSEPEPGVAGELKVVTELDKMADVEYEDKVEIGPDSDDDIKLEDGTKLKDGLKEGTKHEAIEVQLDFNLKTTTTEELDDMIVSGKWLERLSARRVFRKRAYDQLLQSTLKAKKAKAKGEERSAEVQAAA